MRGAKRILWTVAVAVAMTIGYILGCTTPESGAAGAAKEEYKVLTAGQYNEMEVLLNQNAKEGWKVRAGVGPNGVTMAR